MSYNKIIGISIFFFCLLASALGVIVASAITGINNDFTTNFIGFSAGYQWQYKHLWTYISSFLIQMLSVIISFSYTPLLGMTIYKQWEAAVFEKIENNKMNQLLFIFAILIPPYIISFFVIDFVRYK